MLKFGRVLDQQRLIRRADLRVDQTLASDIAVRQDIRTSVRMVLFETDFQGWEYGTHGGTLFIVNYRGKPYALTVAHVAQDFEWKNIVITDAREGTKIAGLCSIFCPTQPEDEAVETDFLEARIIEFQAEMPISFFSDAPYILDDNTVGTARVGDELLVYGALKAESEITETLIKPVYGLFDAIDETLASHDVTLRRAVARFEEKAFDSMTGFSGAPVFDATQNKLCGMVVRGSLNGLECVIRYIDAWDIMELLRGAHEGKASTRYTKRIMRVSPKMT